MSNLKIDKRVAEDAASIRRKVETSKTMTPGEKNSILNRLSSIEIWAKKAAAKIMRGVRHTADYSALTNDDIAAIEDGKKAVWQALLQGRHIDLTASEEFKTSQFHTVISKIRRDIARKRPDLILCDEWVRPGDGRRPYKRYWIIAKEDEDNGDA